MSKQMPPRHRRQMMKENRKQLPVRSVSASEVDDPNNSTFPPDKFFRIGSAKTVESYSSLKAAAQAAGVGKEVLAKAIFYQNKCKGRYWEYVKTSPEVVFENEENWLDEEQIVRFNSRD